MLNNLVIKLGETAVLNIQASLIPNLLNVLEYIFQIFSLFSGFSGLTCFNFD